MFRAFGDFREVIQVDFIPIIDGRDYAEVLKKLINAFCKKCPKNLGRTFNYNKKKKKAVHRCLKSKSSYGFKLLQLPTYSLGLALVTLIEFQNRKIIYNTLRIAMEWRFSTRKV